MPRTTTTLAIATLAALATAPAAFAGGPSGQDLYKANCKTCHAAGSPHGEYTPMTLIQDQWERFFKEKYAAKHATATMPDGTKVLDAITPEMLEKIKKFSIDHAADSEQPMTCGK
ncbi:MAG: cytochrome c [Vicinamibacteria bacterium]|nr:cytochrome c [Vicinamibacteria bacterium]